ncbi:aminomethyl-transferring glycine dehydrogenase subunit GcvPA [bacterium]|nr:aminomethyl-transferring glycine dehydrogenase subunit GcvPA [bacterium]
MSYLPHTADDRSHMLQTIGAASVEDLLQPIPERLRLLRPLKLPEAQNEYDLLQHMKALAAANTDVGANIFVGGGAYNHFIPAVTEMVTSRSEFLTAYTPYQAEASQGTLQTIFEYQTMICRLTGMDVANASVYDGGTAAADALIMAANKTRRRLVYVSQAVNPQVRQVIATYLAGSDIEVRELPIEQGMTVLPELTKEVAAVMVQIPNFFGIVEDGPSFCAKVREAGALPIVAVGDAVSLAMLEAPANYGAAICCGDAQALGLPLSFGGPYCGFLACKQELMRNIPGRLVGITEDRHGKRGYCLTLQAREQHIRREKAASNICSNQGLCALAVTVYLSLVGPKGLQQVARGSKLAADALKKALGAIDGFSVEFAAPTFNEFVLRCPKGRAGEILDYLAQHGIIGGCALGQDYPELSDCLLLCCTELTKPEAVERYAALLRSWVSENAQEGKA